MFSKKTRIRRLWLCEGPNQVQYNLQMEDNGECIEMYYTAEDDASLCSMGFINGRYTLFLSDYMGNETAYEIMLGGDYPIKPMIVTEQITDPINAVVEWIPAPNDVNGIFLELEASEETAQEVYLDDPNSTQFDFGQIDPVGHDCFISFLDGYKEEGEDFEMLVGYLNTARRIVTVKKPD